MQNVQFNVQLVLKDTLSFALKLRILSGSLFCTIKYTLEPKFIFLHFCIHKLFDAEATTKRLYTMDCQWCPRERPLGKTPKREGGWGVWGVFFTWKDPSKIICHFLRNFDEFLNVVWFYSILAGLSTWQWVFSNFSQNFWSFDTPDTPGCASAVIWNHYLKQIWAIPPTVCSQIWQLYIKLG